MRRVIFYEPASRYPHIFKRYRLPRLGSLLLGTILSRAGYDVHVYVEDVKAPRLQDLMEADLVCLSTITSTAMRAYEVAATLRARGVPVVIGGSHVTFLAEEALEHADYVFRGEAECAILQLVEAVCTGDGLEAVRGLSFRRDGKTRHNAPAEPISDLDALPDVDFSLVKGSLRSSRAPLIIPVQTSRGCPYDCSFCSVTKMFGRRYRFRSPGRVLDGLSDLGLHADRVFFYDDHFAANRSRLHEILEGMLSRDLRLHWSAQVRGDVAKDERLVELMRRAGCRTLYIGMESVNPETLKAYRKRQTVAEIEQSIRVIRRNGIRIHGMFVLGADTDTVETIRATASFARANRIETAQFLILTPLPGTKLYNQLDEQGRLLHQDWDLYDTNHVVFDPAQMKPEELHWEAVRAIREFYSLPYIVWELARFRFFEAFLKAHLRRIQLRAMGSGRGRQPLKNGRVLGQ